MTTDQKTGDERHNSMTRQRPLDAPQLTQDADTACSSSGDVCRHGRISVQTPDKCRDLCNYPLRNLCNFRQTCSKTTSQQWWNANEHRIVSRLWAAPGQAPRCCFRSISMPCFPKGFKICHTIKSSQWSGRPSQLVRLTFRDVKASRANWPRGQNFGLGLVTSGLGLRTLWPQAFGLGLEL